MHEREASLWSRYRSTAEANGDRAAIVDHDGRAVSHGELLLRAERAAAGLRDHGLGPGDHLGVFLPNRDTWLVAALAGARAGVGVLGLNTRFRRAELDHLLGLARVGTVLVADRFLGIDGPGLMSELERVPRILVDGDAGEQPSTTWSDLEAAAPAGIGLDPAPTDPAIGFTTSGTTGLPKIAMHDGAQTVAHLDAVVDSFDLDAATVSLVPLPLCGAFGYTVAMATLLAGGTVVLQATWNAAGAVSAITEHGVTFFNASDDMVLELVACEGFPAATSWRIGGYADFTNAGPQAVAAADRASCGRTRLAGLYGSSEGFALMASFDHEAPIGERARNGGHLVSSRYSVRACDPDTGRRLPHEQPGELQFRGPNLIDRYLNDPAASARAFTEDGWYRSGDLGHTITPDARGHQGFVFRSRLGDSLRLRGFLCDPAEIEHHLETHPGVELAQVVGVQRPGSGDVAVAFVRLAPGTDLAAADAEEVLDQHCRAGLANYKRPARIVTVDDFPVTDGPNGIKIRKVDLRDRAAALIG